MFTVDGMTFDEAGPPESVAEPEVPSVLPVKGAFPPFYEGDDDWFFSADDF